MIKLNRVYCDNEAMLRIKTKLIKKLELNPGSMVVTTNITRPYVIDFEGRGLMGTNPLIVEEMIEAGELVFIGVDEYWNPDVTDMKYYQMEWN